MRRQNAYMLIECKHLPTFAYVFNHDDDRSIVESESIDARFLLEIIVGYCRRSLFPIETHLLCFP